MPEPDRFHRKLEPYLTSSRPNSKGEYRGYCPIHEDPEVSETPSASFNFEKGLWYCNSSFCGGRGRISKLVKMMDAGEQPERSSKPDKEKVVDLDSQRAKRRGGRVVELSEAKVKGWHESLLGDAELLRYLSERRGINLGTVKEHKLGYERSAERYTIPIYDDEGRLVNVRRYKPDADVSQKMWNLQGHGSPPRLYPIETLHWNDEVFVTEGELDALVASQQGFPAVSGTGGAGRWDAAWSKEFVGKRVYFCYDNDKDGRTGAKKAAKSVARHASEVWIMPPLMDDEKTDVTDYFVGGGTADGFRAAMQRAERVAGAEAEDVSEATPVTVAVIGSMDSRTNGKPLSMQVTITGKKNPSYSVPHKVKLECTMDAGPKCKVCPMAQEWEGDHVVTIPTTDVATISEFIDANKDKTKDLVRRYVGAQKCNRLSMDELENETIEELFVTASLDSLTDVEASDYTQRRIYNVGGKGDTPTNTAAKVIGTTVPNPKDRRNEFFSWHLEEATTSLDTFTVTPDLVKRLAVFQPKGDERPLDKCRDIAADMSSNVTHILGRERLHMAMDLVWHSVLQFPFDGKLISRGWLEFLVIGDTRTGKSETAIRLANHYRLGHVIGCEGATFAGLIGGAKQVGTSWTITWGEITVNDRRLAVLDEASGLARELISQMSDVRSRGVAQITKIETQQTRARVRLIWISNQRKAPGIDEKRTDGIDMIEDLIGNPEDIARFDFAMSVASVDVPTSKINNPDKPHVPHHYTSDLCHDLVLWAWSRKPDQVEFKEDAYRHVFRMAEKLGKTFHDHPPLVQSASVREKVARMSVALAARTFSTDDTGERIIVTKEHVEDATTFLHKLYSYSNFGYLRLSERIRRNRKIAGENRLRIKKWLRANPRVLEFLLDRRGSFRSQDLEEMAHMQRDEVNVVLGKLADAKMISKQKSQIVIEPELADLLKEMG